MACPNYMFQNVAILHIRWANSGNKIKPSFEVAYKTLLVITATSSGSSMSNNISPFSAHFSINLGHILNRNCLSKNVKQQIPFLIPTIQCLWSTIFLQIYKKTLEDKQVNKIKFLVGIGLFDLSVNKVVKSWHLFFFSFLSRKLSWISAGQT